jgi:hypothetical protein
MLTAITACGMYEDMQAQKQARYEVGEHQGAKSCAECHPVIYDQWSKNSRHAVATTAESFLSFKDQFTSSFMLNTMMGEAMCYACHGSKDVNEGVNCETCHGLAPPDVPIMEVHENKFSPGRADITRSDFCATCHEMKNPMSGQYMMTLQREWENSQAAEDGVTCQGCHMAPRDGGQRYHGFDTAVRSTGIYADDLDVSDVTLEFPRLSMIVENRVIGHSIPAGGPTRTLALEISCKDEEGLEIHKTVKTFAKTFELMPIVGLMPYKLIENSQLRSAEKRRVTFTLPDTLAGKIQSLELVLRMYEVSDEYQGDIEKAHWAGQPILAEEVRLSGEL